MQTVIMRLAGLLQVLRTEKLAEKLQNENRAEMKQSR
jgi:hypothetical protein